uniref:DNA-binding protein D-ETS-4 n=1 Tax=Steinernema glaseri TaxID=37863 RepID=A0A1I7ZJ47_9BILA
MVIGECRFLRPFLHTQCVDAGSRFHANSLPSPVVKVEEISNDSVISDNSNNGLGSWNSPNSGNDAAQMDIYRDLILRHLIQDISTTCAKLSLPTDPFDWTVDQCCRWINEMCVQFQLPTPTNLRVDGRSLLNMTPEEFCARTPQGGGDTLHAQLQLWKTAFESYQQQQNQQPQQEPYLQKGSNKGMQANSDWLSPPSPNEQNMCLRNPSEILPSVQGYLNNFGQNSTDVNSAGLNYYNVASYPNSCAESVESPSSLGSNQQFFANAQHSSLLPSPSDTSDISSNASSVMEDDCMDHLQLLGIQRGQSQMQYGNGLADVNCFGPLGRMDKSATEPSSAGITPFQRSSGTVHLWHFIRELLDHPKQYSSCVRWVDREEGTFKIESSHHLARFWGQRKNRSQMNYDKLSRSLRQYYKKGIIQKPEKKQRLVYKFLPPYNL